MKFLSFEEYLDLLQHDRSLIEYNTKFTKDPIISNICANYSSFHRLSKQIGKGLFLYEDPLFYYYFYENKGLSEVLRIKVQDNITDYFALLNDNSNIKHLFDIMTHHIKTYTCIRTFMNPSMGTRMLWEQYIKNKPSNITFVTNYKFEEIELNSSNIDYHSDYMWGKKNKFSRIKAFIDDTTKK